MIMTIKGLFHDFIYGIQNIIVWFPVVWKDRNWDGDYVYRLLYKKIKLMEKHNCPCAQYVGQEKMLAEIREAEQLLKRITEGSYLLDTLEPVEAKYGEWKLEFEQCDGKPYGTMIDNRSEEHKAAWEVASDEASCLERQDKEDLYKMLSEKLDGWWT